MGLPQKKSVNHEEFLVQPQTSSGERIVKLVRQDRYEVKDLECVLQFSEDSAEVLNYSTFGVAVYTRKSWKDMPAQSKADFILEGHKIATLSLKRVREEALRNGGYKVAFEIQDEPLNLTRIRAVTAAKEIVHAQSSFLRELTNVPDEVKKHVYETKDLLENLESSVNSLETEIEHLSFHEVAHFEQSVIEVVSDQIRDILQRSLDAIETTSRQLSQEQLKASYEFYRGKLNHLLYQSPFSKRSVQKPLGYAGDYEMMNIMYRNENIGTTLFAKSLHRCYMNCSNAQAVRNRISYLTTKIVETVKAHKKANTPLRILSVAAGPAEEVSRLIEMGSVHPEQVEIHLVDQDVGALREAQRNIRAAQRKVGRNFEVRFFHKAIKNLIAEGLPDKYDFIYSAGLFDYFTDPVAQMAAKRLYDMVLPSGNLLIGNFTAAPGIKIRMDLILDWNLIYRTAEDLKKLYAQFGKALHIEFEPEQINLFVSLTP